MDYLELFIKLIFRFGNLEFSGYLPHMSAQFEGGVAHIIAAALQTKGIIDQAKILQNLTELNSIASLFYLFALAMAIGSIAIFGNYRQGIYLLIGPTLYTFMVTTTVETDGVKAQMGDYEIPNSIGRQTRFLKHIRAVDDNGGTKKVSMAFALVDGIATEVIQEITKLLVDTKNRDHLRYVARERALSYLLLDLPMSGVLPSLVSRHQAECDAGVRAYMQAGVDTKKNLNNFSVQRSKEDVAKIKASADEAWGQGKIKFGAGNDYEIKRYLKEMSGKPGFGNIDISDPQDDFWATCKDVWVWIGASFQARAEVAYEESYNKGRAESASDAPDPAPDLKDALPPKLLAAYMYKNTISQASNAQLQAQMFQNNPINAEDLSVAFRHHPGAHARGGYFGMKYFATSIPYIQGLLLYLLSIAFPFFAVLLVMPGKAMNFLLWVSLWVWVKSWDVGFALVLVTKDMFWHMLKHRNDTFDTGSVDWADPSSIFSVILNNDPLATQNLYFELTSFLTVSVPFLTAHFCLGATGMFDMFRNSIDQTSQRFKTWEQKSGTREVLNVVELSHPQLVGAVSELAADLAMNMDSAGQERVGADGSVQTLSRGAQDYAGRPIGRDTKADLLSRNGVGKLFGARNLFGMSAYNIGDVFTRIGNPEYLDQFKKEMAQIDRLERSVNANLPQSAERYKLPEGFSEVMPTSDKSKTTLDELVPKDDLEKWHAANADQKVAGLIDVNGAVTWGELFAADASSKGQRLVLPHAFRGMPRLEQEISPEQLAQLKKSAGSLEMVPGGSRIQALGADGKKVTFEDVLTAGHEDFTRLVKYTGALSGRHYAPQVGEGSVTSMNDALTGMMDISWKGRKLEMGSASGTNQTYSNPFMQYFLETLTGTDASEEAGKPGLDGKP